jgi:hypothetical protein
MASVEPSLKVSHDDLIASLQVLADLKSNQKIRIIDTKSYQIAPDDRMGFRRKLSGDGCQATIEIVSSLMETCIHHSTQLKNATDDQLKEKHTKMIKLYPGSLHGLVRLYDLYRSSNEKEYAAAQRLAIKINNYIHGVKAFLNDEEYRALPDHIKPCEILAEKLTAGKVIQEVAFGAFTAVSTLVSVYSTATAARSVVRDLNTLREVGSKFDLVISMFQLIGRG